MKKHLLLSFLFLLTVLTKAQPGIQWQKFYGGSKLDAAYKTIQTSDGGFLTIAESQSSDGDVGGHHGPDSSDVWIVKTDSLGVLQWQKYFGGTGWEFMRSVVQTSDGGYIMAGATRTNNNGDISGNHGNFDAWLIKIDATGNMQWQKCLGGSSDDYGNSIIQTSDGGYLMAASTISNNGDVSGNHGSMDYWLVKTDPAGNLQWQKCYGGTNVDGSFGPPGNGREFGIMTVIKTTDGGYFIVGSQSFSIDGDVTAHHGTTAFSDIWVLKTDAAGILQWERSLGGTNHDQAYSGYQTPDGGYLISGFAGSHDGDVIGHHGLTATPDLWIVKLDGGGNIKWQKCEGGTGTEGAYSLTPTNDGGYFTAGSATGNHNGDVAGLGNSWVVKSDSLGNIQWQKCLVGDYLFSSLQSLDGGFVLTGQSLPRAGGATGSHGLIDCWIVKLAPVPTSVITGNVYEDLNHNCTKDSNEIGLPGKIVEATPGNYFAVTDANGNYTLFVDSGNYTVSHIPSQYYNQSCPGSGGTYNANINSLTPDSYGNNFADTLNAHCADLKLSVGTSFFRRCFKHNFSVYYMNTGAVTAYNATITVNFDSSLIPLSSSIPWVQNGNNYIFTIDSVLPGQYGWINIVDSVSCTAVIGMQAASAYASIHSSTPECDTTNNFAHDTHTIIGSCDPNGKELATNSSAFSAQQNITATDTLNYTIRFQNTGTDTAFTVTVRDTLPAYLNAATVTTGAASAPYTFRIYGQGILEWTFSNIKLCDSTVNEFASHGFVKFSVKQSAGNMPGTVINNTGAIWFDYNPPVNTNMALATILNTSTAIKDGLNNANLATVYPNPFETSATLKISSQVKMENAQLKLFDMMGNEVRNMNNLNTHELKIDKGDLKPGVYFYQLKNKERLIATGKVVVE